MKVSELMTLLDAKCVTEGADLSAEISCGYSCDLLSWVLAHGKPGMAWCTVQTHVNVIAVSVLMEMACVILVEGVEAEEAQRRIRGIWELPPGELAAKILESGQADGSDDATVAVVRLDPLAAST